MVGKMPFKLWLKIKMIRFLLYANTQPQHLDDLDTAMIERLRQLAGEGEPA